MKWNVSVLRRSGECERTEVADFELSEFFNRIASAEGKAWVLSVERVGDVGDSALVEPDGDELVSQLGKRRWRVMGDPEDGSMNPMPSATELSPSEKLHSSYHPPGLIFDVQAFISSQSVSCAPLRLNHSPRSPLKVRERRTISTESVFLLLPL